MWVMEEGEGGSGQEGGQGRASSRDPAQAPFNMQWLSQTAVPNACVSWTVNNFGCKITVLGYHVRKQLLPALPQPPLSFL